MMAIERTMPSAENIEESPTPKPSVIQGNCWRISILTDSLIRFEWSDSGDFEDLPTLMAANRDFGADVKFAMARRDGRLIIDTAYLHIDYNRQAFSKEGLSIVVSGIGDSQHNTWHFGDTPHGNLKGTERTLDNVDGPVSLEEGVISRDGWAILDDSDNNLIERNSLDGTQSPLLSTTIRPRSHKEKDFYFFGYGHRYIEAVRDFYRLSGSTPLLPRFALGNWWSRYYRYSQQEYLNLMDRFKREGIPFTTAVIDMDWHITAIDPKYGSGWTGYTWNDELFPDHVQFLQALHDRGMKTTLNVHPRDGVRAFEQVYSSMAMQMGIEKGSEEAIEFDLTDNRFIRSYFDMHHQLEREGVDFWWVDWQQGGVTRQPGLDPLWALNYLHYNDTRREGRDRLTFSRYAGPGSHRYPVGFSGDSVISWDSLAFQPYFTAMASNIGYGWWSHDIGGHMLGYRDDELETRWYQLGAFSPINRLHSSASVFTGKEPWNFDEPARTAMVEALRLRHMMLPYLYSMNYRAADEGRPLVEPMYWQNPEIGSAYEVPGEFYFGSQLIAAPITSANDMAAKAGKARVWLPQGKWFDFFDGRHYTCEATGGRTIEVWRSLNRIPVFAHAGAIVPSQVLACGESINSVANPKSMQVTVFPGADGHFTLTEDGGVPGEAVAHTSFTFTQANHGNSIFEIAPVQGSNDSVPESRTWNITFRGVELGSSEPCTIWVSGDSQSESREPVPVESSYDTETLSLTVHVANVSSSQRLSIIFADSIHLAKNPIDHDCAVVLQRAQMSYLAKDKAFDAIRRLGIKSLGSLRTFEHEPEYAHDLFASHMPESVISELEEIFTRS